MVSVGFIGAGNMGFAIIKGIYGSGLCENDRVKMHAFSRTIFLYAYDPNNEMIKRLNEFGVSPCASEAELVEKCDYVFLAVKPQQLETVLDNAKKAFTDKKVIISICAGITAEYIQSKTVADAKVVLVMPNTPLLLGEGASALSRNSKVTEDEFDFVKGIFASCGKAAVVPENKMKEIIAINGSSPAFIYLFAKAFIDYADKEGIDPAAAKELFAQSLVGSAKMITDSGYTIDELIKMVSSPGGTTLAGLDELYSGKLEDTVKKACESCTRRAYELSK
ncbi:MAG: pyrroline-5-carboxylate reductase [Oscillospiraceae bacterium]|nr:pyrroline-5-carboxylate reductase [Oscillospiraceae bacterium]